jgi:two-component system, NtrC family, response regulator AtoC
MGQALLDAPSVTRSTQSPFTILVVEADPSDAELMLNAIEQADLRTLGGEIDIQVRSTAEGAIRLLGERPIDLVLTDFVLPGMDGLDLVNHIQKLDANLPIIVVTRMNSVQTVVDAMRRGAYDYILKPVNPTDLGMRLHRAIRTSEILRFNTAYKRTAQQEARAGNLVGASPAFEEVQRLVSEAAGGRSTVLITGETGTGKGLIARAIHEKSREQDQPYQVIDCTTMPEGMVESELFGHVRGAFTGAIADKPGLIELANGGTVFLDEIGELTLSLQAKLLHVLEENEVRRVGGTRTKRVETRFIAATNQDLEEKVQSGSFRKDLYYRLAVVVIHVPPLRNRQEDIAPIARHLCSRFGREMAKPRCILTGSAMTELTTYHWPGNIRELRNVIERAVMLATEDAITADDIKPLVPAVKRKTPGKGDAPDTTLPYLEAKQKLVADFTSAYLRTQLSIHAGHITRAAEASGIQRHYFSQLMKRYLDRER